MNIFKNILIRFLYIFFEDKTLLSNYYGLMLLSHDALSSKPKKGNLSLLCTLFIFFIVNRQNNLSYMTFKFLKYKEQYIDAVINGTECPKIDNDEFIMSKTIFEAWINEVNLLLQHVSLQNNSLFNFNTNYFDYSVLYFNGGYIYSDKTFVSENIIEFKKKMTYIKFFQMNFLEFLNGIME